VVEPHVGEDTVGHPKLAGCPFSRADTPRCARLRGCSAELDQNSPPPCAFALPGVASHPLPPDDNPPVPHKRNVCSGPFGAVYDFYIERPWLARLVLGAMWG
jgi:hypothetical protein